MNTIFLPVISPDKAKSFVWIVKFYSAFNSFLLSFFSNFWLEGFFKRNFFQNLSLQLPLFSFFLIAFFYLLLCLTNKFFPGKRCLAFFHLYFSLFFQDIQCFCYFIYIYL